MPTSFELRRNDEEQFYFHLVDDKGELLLMSGEYPQKEAAEKAIKAVQVGSLTANQIAAGRVAAGDAFFVIKDSSGDTLVKSVLFDSRTKFDQALHTVKDNTCIAEVQDLT